MKKNKTKQPITINIENLIGQITIVTNENNKDIKEEIAKVITKTRVNAVKENEAEPETQKPFSHTNIYGVYDGKKLMGLYDTYDSAIDVRTRLILIDGKSNKYSINPHTLYFDSSNDKPLKYKF